MKPYLAKYNGKMILVAKKESGLYARFGKTELLTESEFDSLVPVDSITIKTKK